MQHRYQSKFLDAKPEQQMGLVDLIAYRKNLTPELSPGIIFFRFARNVVGLPLDNLPRPTVL